MPAKRNYHASHHRNSSSTNEMRAATICTTPCVASCFTPCETPPGEAQVKPIPLSKNVVGMVYMILYPDVKDLLRKQNLVQVFYMMLVCHSLIHGRGIPH